MVARVLAIGSSGSASCRLGVDFLSDLAVLRGPDLAVAHLVGIFMSVAPEAVRACEERRRCDDDVAMVSVDRIYHVPPASTADLPAF